VTLPRNLVCRAALAAPIALASLIAPDIAGAQEVVTELPEVKLERIPPQYSYDIGLQLGVAELTYFREEVPPWATLGVFGSWGYHIRGNDRVGPGLAVIVEGPIPLHTSLSIEPTFRWDRIMGKFSVGAAAGLAIMTHAAWRSSGTEVAVTPNPMLAARIGWSQGWTRVGRRLFIVAEPKARLISGRINPGISIQVGSGHGY
jgi:hypothetical protein